MGQPAPAEANSMTGVDLADAKIAENLRKSQKPPSSGNRTPTRFAPAMPPACVPSRRESPSASAAASLRSPSPATSKAHEQPAISEAILANIAAAKAGEAHAKLLALQLEQAREEQKVRIHQELRAQEEARMYTEEKYAHAIREEAETSVREGSTFLILSDKIVLLVAIAPPSPPVVIFLFA